MHLKKILFLIISLCSFSSAWAFKLSPIVQSFGFKGKDATKSFRVTNPGKETIRLEVEPFSRSIDLINQEQRAETDKFMVYPPQLEVPAGKSRVIRVTYIGGKTEKEEAYRLIVRQIPNKLAKKKKDKTQINFLFEYVASMYVAPKGISPKLKINSALQVSNHLEINFENIGTEHILLRRYKLELKQGKKKKIISFTSKDYKKFGSQNILASLKRKLILPKIKTFSDGKVEAKFVRVKD